MATSTDPMAGLPTGSTPVPTPTPVADVDPILQALMTSLQTQAAAEATALPAGNQTQWMMPPSNGWNGSVFDFDGMEQPFDRSQSNQWFTTAVKDPSNPGTTGDMIVTTTQIDYLAVAERSFRMRHTMTKIRSMSHTVGRKTGHGNAKGPLSQSVMEYLNGIVKESKAGAP